MLVSLALVLASPASALELFEELPEYDGAAHMGRSYGVAVTDLDADGDTDIIVPYSHIGWLNEGGTGWSRIELPAYDVGGGSQYGTSFGDYDRDGLPDGSTEPRGPGARLLHNEGGGVLSVVPETEFPIVPSQSAETNIWADIDGNGWLDLFVPAYYGASGLYMNQGPDELGAHRFTERAVEANIDLSITGFLRPEGAQLVDVDRDGDGDIFVCGELMMNESLPGMPWFETAWESGVPHAFDEGAAFADVDMDGDLDLGVLYHDQDWTDDLPVQVMLIWLNLGDATFELLDPRALEDIGITETYNLGMSFVDWDLDGDPDLTFSDRFEENRFVQTGELHYERVSTEAAWTNSVPGWFDWDGDGDLDAAMGVWAGNTRFYQNRLYDGLPLEERRYLRVRPVSAEEGHPLGLDTEFGATVELHVAGEAVERRRLGVVASGHGYLNQSEYSLTFGLEGLEQPVVDVSVDFPLPGQEGLWRVDRHINPALGGVDVLGLADRELRVFRDGRAILDGVEHAPVGTEDPLLQTPGGLMFSDVDDDLDPVDAGTWVGLELQLPEDADPERGAALREVLVEGQLDEPIACGEHEGNVLLWELREEQARLVGAASGPVGGQNRRTEVRTDLELREGGRYRVAARVQSLRELDADPEVLSWVEVTGAFRTEIAGDPCDTEWLESAYVRDDERSLTVRWRERVVPEGDTAWDTGGAGPELPGAIEDTAVKLVGDCGCAAAPAGSAPWLLLVAAAGWRRRRDSVS